MDIKRYRSISHEVFLASVNYFRPIGNKIPLDHQPSINIVLGTTDRQLYHTLASASVGITMAMAFLLFNIKHRNNQ